jgi:L-amino acid N-acyltransferase YncA
VIRDATADDAAALARIYGHAVLHGTGTFEIVPPDEDEMRRRWSDVVDRGLPFLVTEVDGVVRGFAYASTYRPRAGYARTVEESVYIDPAHVGQGLGTALVRALIDRCAAIGMTQMIAVIGDTENVASIALHRSLGFTDAGALRSVGYKFDRWLDTVFMQRSLDEHRSER